MDENHNILQRPIMINVSELDERPGPFCMSYCFDAKNLINSFNTVGLINRPLIRRNGTGSIDIVTGYRRILALKLLNRKSIPCIELTDPDLSDRDLLLLNLHDNLYTRSFNNVEKGMILNRLLIYHTMEDIYSSFMGLLDISSRREADLLIRIQELDKYSKDIIASEPLSVKTIESILALEACSRSLALEWILKLKLNINQQMLFFDYFNDISIRDKKGLHELLHEEDFKDLINEDGRNTPQRAKRFIEILKTKRLPGLTRSEKAFAKQIYELCLPENVKIKHSPFFENSDYLLEISFKEGKKLKETLNALGGIQGLADFKDPWKV